MTTAQTNSEETPKKKRLTAATRKRIADLKAEHAELVAAEKTILASVAASRIERLEQGLSEDADDIGDPDGAPEDDSRVVEGDGVEKDLTFVGHVGPGETLSAVVEGDGTGVALPEIETAAAAVTWNDVVAASTEAEANRVTREQCFDRILVDLTPEERAELGAEHVAADAELAELTDEKKEAMADFKARIAKVESRKREIAEAITKKKKWQEPGAGGWICEEIFATNTRRYLDPKTERVMCEEAMGAHERQLALPVVSQEAAEKVAQLSLGDVEPTDMTDPEALLRAAAEGEAEPADSSLDNDGSSDDLGDDDGDAGDGDDEDDDL